MARYKNQSSLLSETKQPSILIVWCWWVWSMAAFYLAKMWLQNLWLIDKDDVEDHNVASQFYQESDIGKPKVEALANNIKLFTWVECTAINNRWTTDIGKELRSFDIVILAADNMDVRKEVVDHYTKDPFCFIIESRMWWLEYIIQSFAFEQYDSWMASRFPQSEADPEVCTEKSICFNTWLIGSKIAETVWKYLTNRPYEFYATYNSITTWNNQTQEYTPSDETKEETSNTMEEGTR